ncbi:hypothetical protein HH303_17390 [Rhodospirillaceae bacterium KN72]|uniref:FecR protein domain-containing protein n=1 Tax=Pacificispira spongiicola TaxID=2729598 RepID=A0A7Y0HI88_9PROT|nr:FecR domain-containing protein [Pacificispira spongiicola]NMM46269.1 hypothetical protein [Pacificispira spongiicola]
MRLMSILFLAFLAAITAPDRASAQTEIGKVTKLLGAASQAMDENVTPLTAGSPVYEDALIETGDDARLEIVFIDSSQITLGERARLVMDDLVYSFEASETGVVAQSFRILDGTFLFLSGAVARTDHDAVSVSTPVATIGIRGTGFFGGPLAAGMPPGELHYGFMLTEGAIDVSSVDGTVTLDEVNEGTFLPMSGQAAPTPPTQWQQEAIDEAYASVAFN